jgi:hypothetical protein
VVWRFQHLLDPAAFHDGAAIHDNDAVGEMRDHREVVRNEEIGDAEAIAQIGEEVEDCRLDGDIERGNRLVAYQQVGFARHRARDADALLLATRELMWIAIAVSRREAHEIEESIDPLIERRAAQPAKEG